MAAILKGKPVVDALLEELTGRVEKLKTEGIVPTLAIVRAGENGSDLAYERSAMAKAEKTGVRIKNVTFPEDADEDMVLRAIQEINEDPDIHGALIFRPLPPQIDDAKVREALAPEKDMDGITDGAMAGVFMNTDTGYPPCTAAAVMETLNHYGVDLSGKKVTVIGRSLVIGRPVAMMLMHQNATVTICHSRSGKENIIDSCRNADIVVACVGRAGFMTKEMAAPGQIVMDVGINFSEEGKMVGDVCFDEVADVVEQITPVPGGIGGVTSSLLMKHVVTAAEKRRNG